MRDFPFGQAVLAGFDLLRRRPVATLGLASIGIVLSLAGRAMAAVSNHLMVQSLDQPNTLAFNSLWVSGVNILVSLVVLSVIVGAVAREGRLRLGGDEARLFVLSLLVVPALVLIALVGALGAAVSVIVDDKDSVLAVAAFGLGAILALGAAGRFWLAGPMSVEAGRLRLAASWRLTRQRPWKVLGAFLVSILLAIGLVFLGMRGVAMAFDAFKLSVTVPFGGSLLEVFRGAFRPAGLAFVVLQGLVLGLAMIVHAAPSALIHRRLIGEPMADQAAVFD